MPRLPETNKNIETRAYEIYINGKDFLSIIDPYLVLTNSNYKSYLNNIHLKSRTPDYDVIISLLKEKNKRISSKVAERILSNFNLNPTDIYEIT